MKRRDWILAIAAAAVMGTVLPVLAQAQLTYTPVRCKQESRVEGCYLIITVTILPRE